MDDMQADRAETQLRAGVYARLSETYDAAESMPTQLDRGTDHAARRGWTVTAVFKDDGFSGFKEITRDGFGELIAAIEVDVVDAVIVRDIDRLLVPSFVPLSVYARLRADAREGRDGTIGGTITHGDGSSVVRTRQRPRLTWMARPASACSRRCR